MRALDPCLSRDSLLRRRPLHWLKGGSSSREARPPRVPHHLLAAQPVPAGPTPLGFLISPTASLGLAPSGVGCQSHPGSALRFSQPLSGFLAHPSFAALFHAAAIPGIRPSELSPRRNRAPLSGSLAPLQSSTACLGRAARTLSPAVSPTPERRLDESRSRPVAWIPLWL